MTKPSQLCGLLFVFAVAALSQACVATATQPPARGFVVTGPPPPPIQEPRSTSPSPTATWVGGYWHWTGAEYAWIPGHWESAPPGASWYGPRYVQTESGYIYEPGGWTGPANGTPAGGPPSSGTLPGESRAAFH